MNAKFSAGPKGELIALSGGYMGKDEMVRPATDDDRVLYAKEYAAFLSPPSPPASDGAPGSAAAAGVDAAGADDTKPPSAG